MKKYNSLLKMSLAVLGSVVLGLGVNYVTAQTASPPGGNVAAPINTGSGDQVKTGGILLLNILGVNGFFHAYNGAQLDGNIGIGTSAAPGSSLTVAGRIESTNGGYKFPDGSIQTTASTGDGEVGTTYSAGTGLDLTGTEFSIANSGVTSVKIADGAILFADWGINGCSAGQIPKYSGSALGWTCSADNTGGGGGSYSAGTGLSLSGGNAFSLNINGGASQTCLPSQKVSGISPTGIVACATDNTGGGGGIGGSGTAGRISKFTAGATLGDSSLTEDGSGNVLAANAFGVSGLFRAYNGAQIDGLVGLGIGVAPSTERLKIATSLSGDTAVIGGNTNLDTLVTLRQVRINTTSVSPDPYGLLVLNGNVGIGTLSPGAKLDVTGKIHSTQDICTDLANGKCLSNAIAGVENLRILRGTISDTGFIWSGSGFTVVKNAIGDFTVTFTTAFSSNPTVTFSTKDGGNPTQRACSPTLFSGAGSDTFRVQIPCAANGGSVAYGAVEWSFIAIGPR